jgi:DNA mismatch repair protein MutL
MKRILALPENVAAQIAAGEVIERPASVVKELIENALDAGATRIDVEISGAGTGLIRCRDDGHGIYSDDLAFAVMRHATSKLETVHDLDHIRTLGFRGEALASVASVSRLTVTSRHMDEETGGRIIVEGGDIIAAEAVGAPQGTSVEVANLFYNVPARRKFLKSDSTERRHISNLLMRYAMAYPSVRFSLFVDDRESFRTAGSGDLADVVIDTLGLDIFRDMVEVSPLSSHRPDLPDVSVSGFTTAPRQTRSNRSQIILFVNGRNIQDQRLTYAVVQAYHTLIPQGRYPITVLMIDIAPEELDVNVHPTKAEVRFRAPDAVFAAVQRAVRTAVLQLSEAPAIHNYQRDWDAPQDAPSFQSNVPRVVDPQQLGIDMDIPDAGRRSNQMGPRWFESDEEFVKNIPAGRDGPARPRNLPPMRVVGQVAAAYIVAEGPAGMYLIDQHAAHERIMYEVFMARHEAQEKLVQHTLESVVVELAPVNARFLEDNLDILLDLGFDIEPFGNNSFRVRALPAVLADHDPGDVLYRVMQDIESGDEPGAKDIEDKIVRRVCKTAAVKAGQILSYDEMQGIIRQLERCDNPHTCPHGRPTLIHMSSSDLAREFGRT